MNVLIEHMKELLHLMQEADLPTLRVLDQKLHVLLTQKETEQKQTTKDKSAHIEFRRHYPHITVEPALFDLVGIQPENPFEEDKRLIREQIFRRLTE